SLLSMDALSRALGGDGEGALDSCRGIALAARSLGDEPAVISQLFRKSAVLGGALGIERTLGLTQPSPQALERTRKLLERERAEYPALLVQAIRGERGSLFEAFRKIADGESPLNALTNVGGAPRSPVPVLDEIRRWAYVGPRMRFCQALVA